MNVVLEAAARVLLVHGYGDATTNRVAEAAGVSVGTVYEYFANKEEVFDALIRRELAALVGALRGQEPSVDVPVIETFARIIVAGVGAMRFGPELLRALEQAPAASFRRHLAEARSGVLAFAREILELHRAELRVTDLDTAAFVVVSAVEGVAANATRDQFDRALIRELTALLEGYLTGGRRD